MSHTNPDSLWVTAIAIRTAQNSGSRTPGPSPATENPTTALTQRKSPERASISSLHPPATDSNRSEAAELLCDERLSLIEDINEDERYKDSNGELKEKWLYRVAAMDVDDYGSLVKEPDVPSRPGKSLTIEEMEQQRALERAQRGQSSLRNEFYVPPPASTDPKAGMAAQQRRRVGGQHLTEGDLEEAAVADSRDEVDEEVEGSL